MAKLNQVIAVLKGRKSRAEKSRTEVYKSLQKSDVFNGLNRVYTPKDDEGDMLPPEKSPVRATVGMAIDAIKECMTDLIDVSATLGKGNTNAKADIVVDGEVIVANVPVTTLLSLEKELQHLVTLCTSLPELADDTQWTLDANSGHYVSESVVTTKTKKIPKVQVLYEATDKHPAQVQAYHEDVIVGTWKQNRISGAIPTTEKAAIVERSLALLEAVKKAREQANTEEVEDVKIASVLLGHVFK